MPKMLPDILLPLPEIVLATIKLLTVAHGQKRAPKSLLSAAKNLGREKSEIYLERRDYYPGYYPEKKKTAYPETIRMRKLDRCLCIALRA